MTSRPHILITNDDGISAAGIKHLWKALSTIADVTVVAPFLEQSATGLSITIRAPLRIEQILWDDHIKVWGVSGTPADCVKLGLSVVVDRPVDLVCSGINRGTNAGRNVLYSGTVGGAIEGVMHDIPSIAFSCQDFDNPNYGITESHIVKVVSYVLKQPMAVGTLLNVNFPGKKHSTIQGFKLTRQGKELWVENPDKRHHPFEDHAYYWLGAKRLECDEEEDCDISWLRKGYMTAVPVHIRELTDHQHLNEHREHFEKMMHS